jgi:gamma-glutamyltranspeptidase / glutathione hydrolase
MFNYAPIYPSQRSPVMANNIVATSQPLATQAGMAMYARGGNAVDAAVATAIALTVVEPTMNGIGSDAFCILWDGQSIQGLNASGRAPAAWSPARFAGRETMPLYGWDSVTVPGAVSQWVELSRRYGKLPFANLFEPAIRYARDGFIVSPIVARQWANAVPKLKDQPGWAEHFLVNARAPLAGERFVSADKVRTLERIAATKGDAFYKGELAAAMAAHAKANGGAMTEADLAAHACDWLGTISQTYRGYALHEIPPNGQGIAALVAAGILEQFDLSNVAVDSVEFWHLQMEAMRVGYTDAYEMVADDQYLRRSSADLLQSSNLKKHAESISKTQAGSYAGCVPPRGGTVYLTTADASGMMVSFIQSNYMGFGSGVVVPGTGIAMQNRGAGFTLKKGHANEVGGGKRPRHTILPAFITKDGKPMCSFGVMGGVMQPQGHLQMLVRMTDYQQNPQSALDAPRFCIQEDGTVKIESQFTPQIFDALKTMGHPVVRSEPHALDYGSGQIIWKLEGGGYVAGSDMRRDGGAAGV